MNNKVLKMCGSQRTIYGNHFSSLTTCVLEVRFLGSEPWQQTLYPTVPCPSDFIHFIHLLRKGVENEYGILKHS